eukprot:TRINITY_DN2340_c0_g1_i1.p1 TRINITY_DN2340_c0_g1~~TRINITY_DN2340_c0_g1_i1.p1  ORF type:complete len:175 (-),score=15.98 TRINITY_DN2340_c0_g1_i1:89-613(-)
MLYNIDPIGMIATGAFYNFRKGMQSKSTAKIQTNLNLKRITNGNIPEAYSAIRVGKWKLIQGQPGRGDWYGTDPSHCWQANWIFGPDATNYDLVESGGPNADMKLGDGGQVVIARKQGEFGSTLKSLWLFDLEQDPAEHKDISAQFPNKVKELQSRIEYQQKNIGQWTILNKAI